MFLYNFGVYGARLTSASLAVSLLLHAKDKDLLQKVKIPLLLAGPVLSVVLVAILMGTADKVEQGHTWA